VHHVRFKHSFCSRAAGFLTVLTMTTFLFTSDVLNAPLGAYAWCVARDWRGCTCARADSSVLLAAATRTHNSSGTPASVIGTHASLLKNSVIVMFAGLVLLDVANMALVLTIVVDAAGDTHDQPAAAGDKQVAATQEEAAPATADDAAAAV
jgi:hypothetical protein